MATSGEFVQWKEKQNIVQVEIPNKNEYFFALMNIENSWTGRLDAQLANTFIMEAVQLICNAIILFEKGYFDCAYYSLRQSIEVSTTMIYLSDIPDDFRKEELEAWKKTKKFPMQGQMLRYLKENGYLFSDLKNKLSDYFVELSKLSGKLNKVVHKQGLKYFYVSRNHLLRIIKDNTNEYIDEFKLYVEKCIGAVAIMRLAIDPYPILLMDEEIYYRSFDTMTSAYTEEFVEKFIGNKLLSEYKKTEVFNSYHKQHMKEEKKLDCVANIVKYQYINNEQLEKIVTQLHLLQRHDLWAVMLVMWCSKIVKIYMYDGLKQYFTNFNTNRKAKSWNSADFTSFSKNFSRYNQEYDEAYISVFSIHEENYFIEHNDILTKEEIEMLNANIKKYSN